MVLQNLCFLHPDQLTFIFFTHIFYLPPCLLFSPLTLLNICVLSLNIYLALSFSRRWIIIYFFLQSSSLFPEYRLVINHLYYLEFWIQGKSETYSGSYHYLSNVDRKGETSKIYHVCLFLMNVHVLNFSFWNKQAWGIFGSGGERGWGKNPISFWKSYCLFKYKFVKFWWNKNRFFVFFS